MNIVTRSGVAVRRMAPGTINRMPSVRLPIYLHLVLVILAVTAGVLIGWVMLIRQNVQPVNPFTPYAEIFPGQPRSTLIKQKFSCVTNPTVTSSVDSKYCTHWTGNDPFWLISTTLKNGIVHRIDFTIREGTLTLGDLIFIWGRPKIRRYQKSVLFDWQHLGISGTGWAESRQFSYFMPVTRISIGPSSNIRTGQLNNNLGKFHNLY